MTDQELAAMADEFGSLLQEWNKSYEEYAKAIGLTYSRLLVMDMIYSYPDACTQSFLCEQGLLPKQTVNTIIASFLEQGIIELRQIPTNRRSKSIVLTEYGRTYIGGIIPGVKRAEYMAMERIDPQTREVMIRGIRQYVRHSRDLLGIEK